LLQKRIPEFISPQLWPPICAHKQSYPTLGPVSTGIGDCVGAQIPGAEHVFRYVTSHPGQLSLVIPL